jgi:hypothetical protein
MFQELKTAVDIVNSALDLRAKIVRRKRKRELLLALLTFYFCLNRLIENGYELLSVSGREPLKRVMTLAPEERLKFSSEIYSLLLTQRLLLGKLSDLIYAPPMQPMMELFDASLKRKLQKLVNSKERGLLSIGAALEFYFVFGDRPLPREVEKYGEEVAKFRYQTDIVSITLSGRSRKVISIKSTKSNLESLSEAGEKLRERINHLFTKDEQIEFVKKAEKVASSI